MARSRKLASCCALGALPPPFDTTVYGRGPLPLDTPCRRELMRAYAIAHDLERSWNGYHRIPERARENLEHAERSAMKGSCMGARDYLKATLRAAGLLRPRGRHRLP